MPVAEWGKVDINIGKILKRGSRAGAILRQGVGNIGVVKDGIP